ncbi:HEAT repeat domain-containing protein [Planctomycetota bacterium]
MNRKQCSCLKEYMIFVILILTAVSLQAGQLDRKAPLVRRWYNCHELLTELAKRDNIKWALPETLAGNALVGGKSISVKTALDEACKQWNLTWTESNGIVVVHKPDDAALKKWSAALKRKGSAGAEAAWELGWLRHGRAVPVLTEALAGSDTAVALAAARAVEILDKRIPLGRTDRVDPVLPGRVSLAAAFPPKADLLKLLDSPYPPLRAAALRLLLGTGGRNAETAKSKTLKDRSTLVQRVRQQMLYPVPKPNKKGGAKKEVLPPLPKTPEEVKAECTKMLGEIPGLAKNSDWGKMRWRARVIASWAAMGSSEAVDALIELSHSKQQRFWYPAYVMKYMASCGDPKTVARLKQVYPKAGWHARATLARGIEKARFGTGLLEFTKPFLNEQPLCYISARKAGREIVDDLVALSAKAAKGGYSSIDALGAVGGPKAIAALTASLNRDEPTEHTIAFRSAKALGRAGGSGALEALVQASKSPARVRRHAAVLYLGQIGGPKASARLKEILSREKDRLIRRAAVQALEEIGIADTAALVKEFHKKDKGCLPLVYKPRNSKFGPSFQTGKWVDLKIRIKAYAAYGEMGWNYDAANKFHFRYGGCSGYTCEFTAFDLGSGKFVQRRPNEELVGWDSRRPQRGCSAGRTWDPYLKCAWIGPSIGGSAADVAMGEYYVRGGTYALSSYDFATDIFRSSPRAPNCGCYAYDWKNGLMMPVAFTHPNHITKNWWVLDTRSPDPYSIAAWKNKTDQKAVYPFSSTGRYTIGAVDQETGILVVFVPVHNDPKTRKPGLPSETWTWNPRTNKWKNMNPAKQPQPGVWGCGFVYDPFSKKLILHAGKKTSQYGGPKDAMTWTYELKTNTWTEVADAGGPGNPWVGAMTFDPEHNAALVFNFRGKTVWAYRHAQVPAGTSVQLGSK